MQARVVITWPRNERCTDCSSPVPPQVAQVRGDVPGAHPEPEQVSQRTAVSTVSSRRTPNAASSRVSVICSRASAPGRTRLRRDAATAAAGTAEERLEHVAEPAEAGERIARRPRPLRERIAAEVDDAALLGIGEHLVGGGDLFEPVLGGRIRVHVRVQLARQPAVGALELLGRRVLADAEHPVVVPG